MVPPEPVPHHRPHRRPERADAEYTVDRGVAARGLGVAPAGTRDESRRFLSTEHLSSEAVAAYVDRALPPAGAARAEAHLERCGQCRRDVADQRDARTALRGSGPIRMPDDLRTRLRGLPDGPPPPSVPVDETPSGGLRGLVRRLRARHSD